MGLHARNHFEPAKGYKAELKRYPLNTQSEPSRSSIKGNGFSLHVAVEGPRRQRAS